MRIGRFRFSTPLFVNNEPTREYLAFSKQFAVYDMYVDHTSDSIVFLAWSNMLPDVPSGALIPSYLVFFKNGEMTEVVESGVPINRKAWLDESCIVDTIVSDKKTTSNRASNA